MVGFFNDWISVFIFIFYELLIVMFYLYVGGDWFFFVWCVFLFIIVSNVFIIYFVYSGFMVMLYNDINCEFFVY